MAVLHQYLWLVVVGALGAFGFGYGTGANDVANAFATSVGAKTLTLRQATFIAAIFEFGGALLLGRVVTNTISGGIADIAVFQREPEFYAYGMVIALGVGTIWLLVASYFGLNVSSTHSIIGAIIGFALVYAGADAVIWADRDTNNFPPYKGVVPIILSWFVSPILTGLAAALIFGVCRFLILRRENSWNVALWVLPFAVAGTTWINMWFVFTKGAKKSLDKNSEWPDSKSAWVAALIAAGMFVLSICLLPFLRKRANAAFAEKPEEPAAKEMESVGPVPALEGGSDKAAVPAWQRYLAAGKKAALHGVDYDIHKVIEEDAELSKMHENAEVFDPKTEYAFSYLQVFSAICVIFAHGAGEVGYMAGPLGAIYQIYDTGRLDKNVEPKFWIIFIGASGLVLGLATYGYKVTQAMGTMLSKLSPSRGFAAELATALVITIAAQYGLPTSSSQCITGGIIGVGILEGLGGVNWRNFFIQFMSWVATLFVIGGFVALVYAQGIYSPSKPQGEQIIVYEDKIVNTTRTMVGDLNTTLYSFRNASQAGVIPTLTFDQWRALNASLSSISKSANDLLSTKQQTTDAYEILKYLNRALRILENNTILTLGQTAVRAGAPICNSNVTADLINGISTAACPAARVVPRGAYL